MPSPLVKRYANLSKRPLIEVEDIWRSVRRKCTESGERNNWTSILKEFKSQLGLDDSDGRVAFLHESKAEVVSESPEFALIRLCDPTQLGEDLRSWVEQSGGLLTVSYNHLFNQPTPESKVKLPSGVNECTTSISVGCGPCGSAMAFAPGVYVVNRKNKRKAIVSSPGSPKSKIQYVDHSGKITGDEDDVSNDDLAYPRSGLFEQAEVIWSGMSEGLNHRQRTVAMREILKFEGGVDHIPDSLIETVIGSVGAQRSSPEVALTDDDWAVVFSADPKDDTVDQKTSPLPSRPVRKMKGEPKDTEPKEGDKDEVKKSRSDSTVRTPSEDEINSLINQIGESRNRVNLKSMADSLGTVTVSSSGAPVRKDPIADKQARLAASAAQWDNILSNAS